MLLILLQAIYFILPAYLANMAPIIFAKAGWFESLNKPVEGRIKLGQQGLFGKNKTWRGLLSGAIGGVTVAFLQNLLFAIPLFNDLSIVNYHDYWLIFGLLAGIGALLGDLAKSFFKRRIGIKSGGVWPIFDQLDFIAGFLIFTYWIAYPDWQIILAIILMTLLLHPLTNIIGYLIGWKKVWW